MRRQKEQRKKTGIICSVGLYQRWVVIRIGRERELKRRLLRPVGGGAGGMAVRHKIPLGIVIFQVLHFLVYLNIYFYELHFLVGL